MIGLRLRHDSKQYGLLSFLVPLEDGYHQSSMQLVSFFPENRTVATTNGQPTIDQIPGASATFHSQADLEELEAIHTKKIADLSDSPTALNSNADVIREVDAFNDRYFRHLVERGVMIECFDQ